MHVQSLIAVASLLAAVQAIPLASPPHWRPQASDLTARDKRVFNEEFKPSGFLNDQEEFTDAAIDTPDARENDLVASASIGNPMFNPILIPLGDAILKGVRDTFGNRIPKPEVNPLGRKKKDDTLPPANQRQPQELPPSRQNPGAPSVPSSSSPSLRNRPYDLPPE